MVENRKTSKQWGKMREAFLHVSEMQGRDSGQTQRHGLPHPAAEQVLNIHRGGSHTPPPFLSGILEPHTSLKLDMLQASRLYTSTPGLRGLSAVPKALGHKAFGILSLELGRCTGGRAWLWILPRLIPLTPLSRIFLVDVESTAFLLVVRAVPWVRNRVGNRQVVAGDKQNEGKYISSEAVGVEHHGVEV
jgi:hypothetical protein